MTAVTFLIICGVAFSILASTLILFAIRLFAKTGNGNDQ